MIITILSHSHSRQPYTLGSQKSMDWMHIFFVFTRALCWCHSADLSTEIIVSHLREISSPVECYSFYTSSRLDRPLLLLVGRPENSFNLFTKCLLKPPCMQNRVRLDSKGFT